MNKYMRKVCKEAGEQLQPSKMQRRVSEMSNSFITMAIDSNVLDLAAPVVHSILEGRIFQS